MNKIRKPLITDSLIVPFTSEYSPRYVENALQKSYRKLSKSTCTTIKSRTRKQEEYGLKRQMLKTKQWGRLKQIVRKPSRRISVKTSFNNVNSSRGGSRKSKEKVCSKLKKKRRQ